MNINSLKKILLIFLLILSFYIQIDFISAAYTEENIGTYEDELSRFPESYKSKIEELHQIYPNARFVAQDKFFDWSVKKEVEVDWNRMLSSEYYEEGGELSFSNRARSLIYETFDIGYRSSANWAYDYYTDTYTKFDNGKWFAAAKATIAYYMDPRNFLDSTYVFMFESHLFNEYQTIEGIEKILNNTFMSDKVCPGTEDSETGTSKKYSEVIMEAAKTNDVSAYMLASRLRQEQGTKGTSSLISGTKEGYEGYYNYFNVSANGTGEEIVINGLNYAKSQNWNSPYVSIIGGSSFIKTEYVGINDEYDVKGQLTGYLQKWDPYGWKLGGHQYMQNITAHYTEASSTYNSYASQDGYQNFNYIFYIPVYKNLPNETVLPKKGSPNNFLKTLTVGGALVEGFDGAKTDYTYTVAEGTDKVYVDYTKVNSHATVTGAGEILLDTNNKVISLVVTAQNGDQKTYNLTIKQSSTGYLSVGAIVNKAGIKSDGTYMSGFNLNTTINSKIEELKQIDQKAEITMTDNSGNSKVEGILSTGDKLTIKSGSEEKTFTIVIYGDITGDGLINSADLLKMRQHLINPNLGNEYYKSADVNKDNKLNSTDLLKIRQHLIDSVNMGIQQ